MVCDVCEFGEEEEGVMRAAKDFVMDYMLAFAILVCGVVLLGLLILAMQASAAEAARCEAQGGHISTSVDSGVAVNPKGGVSPVITASSSCLTADGRIIENY